MITTTATKTTIHTHCAQITFSGQHGKDTFHHFGARTQARNRVIVNPESVTLESPDPSEFINLWLVRKNNQTNGTPGILIFTDSGLRTKVNGVDKPFNILSYYFHPISGNMFDAIFLNVLQLSDVFNDTDCPHDFDSVLMGYIPEEVEFNPYLTAEMVVGLIEQSGLKM